MDYDSVPDTSAQKTRLCRLVIVSFGLLCIFQATLNISLRLVFTSQKNILTEERDDLKRKVEDLASQKNILTGESDDLKRKLEDLASQNNILTGERDDLKRKLEDLVHCVQQRWPYFNGSLYYVSSTMKNWDDSRDDCLQRGAILAIINSKEEEKFIWQFRRAMWIGLTDNETEGVWKWVDETPLTESFWYSGEPNSYMDKDEDCVVINYHKGENNWNDAVCEYQNYWLCEKKIVT